MRRLMLALLSVLLLVGLTVAPARAEGPIVGNCGAGNSFHWNQIWAADVWKDNNVGSGVNLGTIRVYMDTTYNDKCAVYNKTVSYGSSTLTGVGAKLHVLTSWSTDLGYYRYYAGPVYPSGYPQVFQCLDVYWDVYTPGNHTSGTVYSVACN